MSTFDDALALVMDELVSAAQRTGLFDSVAGHEPKSAPGTGLHCGLWISDMRPAASGLAALSVAVEFQYRIYLGMLTEPQDAIDPAVTRAAAALFGALCGNFLLDDTSGAVRSVDVLGSDSEGMRAKSGYLSQDSKLFRVMDIFVPIVINDAFTEVA